MEWKNVKIVPDQDILCTSFNPNQNNSVEVKLDRPQKLKGGVEYEFVYNKKDPGKSKFKIVKNDKENNKKNLLDKRIRKEH